MGKIKVNPNSKSEYIDLIDADELEIIKKDEVSQNSMIFNHSIVFLNESGIQESCDLIISKKYDTHIYKGCFVQNNNPQCTIELEYEIRDNQDFIDGGFLVL
jgi:hypothetical protein